MTDPVGSIDTGRTALDPGRSAPSREFRKVIRMRHAVALYVSSVLGSGILILPGLVANLAGPASLLAWGLLAVASLPFALMFASLSARRPQAGGVYAFAKEAFGRPAALTTGWLFALWQVTGAPAVALIAASYLRYAFPIDRAETFVLAFAVIFAAFAVNYGGIRLSSRVQLTVIVSIVGLLVTAVAVAGSRVRAANFQPFDPHGLVPIGTAAALIFWSFLGYENVSNVAEEFEDPRRDFRRAVYRSVAIVGGLYFAVAFVTVGTASYLSGGSVAPFAALLGNVLGPYAAAGTALLAVFIVFGVVNAYTTGMSRVTYVTARDGGFPGVMARLDARTQAPSRALLTLFLSEAAVFALYYFANVSLATALLVASGAAIVVYIIGSAAGVRIYTREGLPGRSTRWLAIISLGVSVAVLPFVGWPVAAAAVVALGAGLYFTLNERWRRPTHVG
ncbi:MAG: amino acid permease [Thermoplasmata archaeon]